MSWRCVPPPFTLSGMNRSLTLPLLTLTLLGSIACGSKDDSNGPTRVESGIDDSKPLNTLTPTEVEQLATAVMQTMLDSQIIERLCVASALFGEEVANQTEAEVASCEELTNTCLEGITTGSTTQDPTVLANCTATVGQYEACLNAVLGLAQNLLGGLSCDSAPQARPTVDLSTLETKECETFVQLCPSQLSDQMDELSPSGETIVE